MLYHQRRNALMDALSQQLGRSVEVIGGEAGQHLVVKLARGLSDKNVALRAAEQKLWLWPLSPCYLQNDPPQGFILGFGSTSTRQMPRAVHQLGLLLSNS